MMADGRVLCVSSGRGVLGLLRGMLGRMCVSSSVFTLVNRNEAED